MVAETRIFGKIDVDDSKIIHFPEGIIGFPDMQNFTLIFDEEKGNARGLKWLQSLDEPNFAMPVMNPLDAKEEYNPVVEDEHLKPLGEFTEEDLLILITVTVPSNIEEMTVNLQAPFIINAKNRKACQLIIDDVNGEYPVRYKIYDILKANKEKGDA